MSQRKTTSRAELISAAHGALRRLSTEVDGLDQRAAAQFRISRTDLHLIDRLRSEGPQTPSQLARSVGLTSGGLSIALERLERLGYIRRSLHPHDRRSILVEPTEAIVPLETEVFGPLIQRIKALLESYNDKQLTSIRDFLDQAGTAISQSAPGTPTRSGDDADPARGDPAPADRSRQAPKASSRGRTR